MSMPDETPAAVIILPCSTTRRDVGRAPKLPSSSISSQCVVASSPSSSPAAASTSEPVQTEVVQSEVSWAERTQPSSRSSSKQRPRADPTRDHDDLGVRHVLVAPLGHDREHPVVGPHGTRLGGQEADRGAREAGQHLVGPHGIQGGEAVIDRDGDLHVGSFVGTGPQAARRSAAWKRSRYWPGLTPTLRRNARRSVSTEPNPHARGHGGGVGGGGLE